MFPLQSNGSFWPSVGFFDDLVPEAGIGDGGSDCATKIGSPSSSNSFEVTILHGGYFLAGLTFAEKLLSSIRRAFPGT